MLPSRQASQPQPPAIAAAGGDVPTAVALALEDATTGTPHLTSFWLYIKTGDPGPDVQAVLEKWRKTARAVYR